MRRSRLAVQGSEVVSPRRPPPRCPGFLLGSGFRVLGLRGLGVHGTGSPRTAGF